MEPRILGFRYINVIDCTVINPVRCRSCFLYFLIVLKLLLSSTSTYSLEIIVCLTFSPLNKLCFFNLSKHADDEKKDVKSKCIIFPEAQKYSQIILLFHSFNLTTDRKIIVSNSTHVYSNETIHDYLTKVNSICKDPQSRIHKSCNSFTLTPSEMPSYYQRRDRRFSSTYHGFEVRPSLNLSPFA